MNIHKNARLTPLRREEMALSVIEGRLSKAHAARLYGVTGKVVARWIERFKAEGRAGMVDRSSRPRRMPQATARPTLERIGARFGRDGACPGLVGVIALIAGLGSTGANWPGAIVFLTGFFAALWLLSAWLFRKAAREQTPAGAAP